MDLQHFIQQVKGDWFTQKTVYDLVGGITESHKTNQSMVLLQPGDGAIAPLCEQCGVNPEQVWGALQTQWDNAKVDPYKAPEQGQALLVLLTGDNAKHSRFIRSGSTEIGDCCLDDQDLLTLTQQHGGLTLCDRLWFATDNLRFRTGTVEQNGKISHTSFYSEIRRSQS